jgi:hypothetical protein
MDKSTINDEELIKRLNDHPVLRARIASLLDVVDDMGDDLKRADEIESAHRHVVQKRLKLAGA